MEREGRERTESISSFPIKASTALSEHMVPWVGGVCLQPGSVPRASAGCVTVQP